MGLSERVREGREERYGGDEREEKEEGRREKGQVEAEGEGKERKENVEERGRERERVYTGWRDNTALRAIGSCF